MIAACSTDARTLAHTSLGDRSVSTPILVPPTVIGRWPALLAGTASVALIVWIDVLKQYAQMVVYPPLQRCEWRALDGLGLRAGSNALTVNTGMPRGSTAKRRSYCAHLDAFVQSAAASEDTLFVVIRARLAQFVALTDGWICK
jgi:hypothetical protein